VRKGDTINLDFSPARGMVMSGKGTLRQQNELREKARHAAKAQARSVAYTAKAFGEVAE
jgi:predicted HicB family RNase H-like nuclease